MDTVVMAKDLMYIHNFHGQMVVYLKMFLFLELIIVLLRILIIRKIKKDILALGDGPTKGLDDTTMKAEANHSINFTMPYNGRNKFLICQCSKNISTESNRFRKETISIMFRKYFKRIKKKGLESSLRIFSVYAKNISDIHRFLMKQK